jgi:hypothetical protein
MDQFRVQVVRTPYSRVAVSFSRQTWKSKVLGAWDAKVTPAEDSSREALEEIWSYSLGRPKMSEHISSDVEKSSGTVL